MKAVIQRVSRASITINNEEARRSIGKGLVVFLAIGCNDTEMEVRWIVDKILNLRVFYNDQGKFDTSITDINGAILLVSQFTLFGSCLQGRRPDFSGAARKETAIPLYEQAIALFKSSGLAVETGEFGADMQVEIHNDGPVTIEIDTDEKNL